MFGTVVVLLIGGDLMAKARVEAASKRAGAELVTAPSHDLDGALSRTRPELLILDLDSGGAGLLDDLKGALAKGLPPGRVVGFYSHIDDELRRGALEAGCTPLPRGRFWRELGDTIGGHGA